MPYRAAGMLCAFLALTACGGAGDAPPAPAPASARAPTGHPGDVAFMQGMIGHHAQAVLMAAMVPSRGAGERLQALAKKIDISQHDEMKLMKTWLLDRGQPLPDSTAHMHHMMPGMLTAEQLAQLEAARGVEFERLFLTFMIQHHEGALMMVDSLFATPGAGEDSDIFQFATDVKNDQQAEIDAMHALLNALPGSPHDE